MFVASTLFISILFIFISLYFLNNDVRKSSDDLFFGMLIFGVCMLTVSIAKISLNYFPFLEREQEPFFLLTTLFGVLACLALLGLYASSKETVIDDNNKK